ncbi:MAG TPA: TlpA disulfide reductase family protein [Candidatus Dormibacteraeota bacterium]|nr:TlpA disulfide reductase family protein [Candidatus Dormibacteraeota bacterium]
MWKRRILPYLVLVAAAVLVAIFSVPNFRAGQASIAGRTAHSFSFSLDGHPTSLSAFRGKIVVLNFWATWCPPCVDETASLERMYTELHPLGITVLGISVDDDSAAYHKFLIDHHITFPTYRDASKKIPLSYGTAMYPETYVIGRNGKIDRKLIGEQTWDSPHMIDYFRAIAKGQTPTKF